MNILFYYNNNYNSYINIHFILNVRFYMVHHLVFSNLPNFYFLQSV